MTVSGYRNTIQTDRGRKLRWHQSGVFAPGIITQKKEKDTMKNPFSPKKTVSIIAVAMIMLITLTNLAQAGGPAKGTVRGSHLRDRVRSDVLIPKPSQSDQVQYSQDDLEQTRTALLELAGAVKDLTQLAPGAFDTTQLEDARKQVSEYSYQQLTLLRKSLNPSRMNAKLAGVRASIASYKPSMLSRPTQSQSTREKAKKGKITPADITAAPDDDFPARDPFCKDPSGAEYTTRIPVQVILTADVVYFLAELARDLAQDGCNEVLVALGEGGNARAVCIATDTIYNLAHALNEAIHFCNEEFTDSTVDATYDRLDDIHTDLLETQTNDNTNATNIQNNDNSNKTMIITEIDSKSTALSQQISGGTQQILNEIDSKATAIINNDNTNRSLIITNANSNTANIITNDNANTTTIVNNANANLATTINELRNLGCEVIRLLNTPDGQKSSSILSCQGKPGWPYSWNKTTSAPVAAASVITSDAAIASGAPASFSNQRGQDGVPILPLVGTVTMERNLLDGKLIPSYYLPANRGGMIEQVKALVWNTIQAQVDLNIAANETTLAKAAAQQADELLAKGKYLQAYRQYCLAYQQLIPTN